VLNVQSVVGEIVALGVMDIEDVADPEPGNPGLGDCLASVGIFDSVPSYARNATLDEAAVGLAYRAVQVASLSHAGTARIEVTGRLGDGSVAFWTP
jgi:hypothetical protein